jgi:hypothetical protein
MHGDSAAEDVRDRELGELEVEPAGFDLGEVEDIVDQSEQVLAGPRTSST